MIHAKKRRPILLSRPYLAMWLWLIVPLTLHGLVPLGFLAERQVAVHLGGWVEEIEGAGSLSEALRVMRRDRSYRECRYVGLTQATTSLIILPANDLHCSFLRLPRRNAGRVLGSISNADLINNLMRTLK